MCEVLNTRSNKTINAASGFMRGWFRDKTKAEALCIYIFASTIMAILVTQ